MTVRGQQRLDFRSPRCRHPRLTRTRIPRPAPRVTTRARQLEKGVKVIEISARLGASELDRPASRAPTSRPRTTYPQQGEYIPYVPNPLSQPLVPQVSPWITRPPQTATSDSQPVQSPWIRRSPFPQTAPHPTGYVEPGRIPTAASKPSRTPTRHRRPSRICRGVSRRLQSLTVNNS